MKERIVLINPFLYVNGLVRYLLFELIALITYVSCGADGAEYFSVSSLLFFLLLFVITVFFNDQQNGAERMGFVTVDDRGIKCNGVFIRWHDITAIREEFGYITKDRRWIRDTYSMMWRYTHCIGYELVIFGSSSDNETKKDSKIRVYRYKWLINEIKAYRPELIPGEPTPNDKRVLSRSGGIPRIIMLSITKNLFFSGIAFFLISMLSQGIYLINFIDAVLIFLMFFWIDFNRYRDGFITYKLTEEGILYRDRFIPWGKVTDVSLKTAKMIVEPLALKCGTVICVNSGYDDELLDRHSPFCAYVPFNKNTESVFIKYCKAYRDMQHKYREL